MKTFLCVAFSAFAMTWLSSVNRAGAQPHADSHEHGQHEMEMNHDQDTHDQEASENEAEIQEKLAKLKPQDRRLAEAQKFCPIMPKNRLGSMGTPIKVMIDDQPVFVCCKGCRAKALANPDKTLAKVAELKAKVKAESGQN